MSGMSEEDTTIQSVAIVQRTLPPEIEAYRQRLTEIIRSIEADAKKEIDRVCAGTTLPDEKEVLKIIDRAQRRATEFDLELIKIEEVFASPALVVSESDLIKLDIPAVPLAPLGENSK